MSNEAGLTIAERQALMAATGRAVVLDQGGERVRHIDFGIVVRAVEEILTARALRCGPAVCSLADMREAVRRLG